MNDINVVAKREKSSYRVSVDLDNRVFTIKFDPGATDTVISARVFSNSLADQDLESLTKYCEEHSKHNSLGIWESSWHKPSTQRTGAI